MQSIEFYQNEFLSYLEGRQVPKNPKNLYDPIDYILTLGGKRLRPVLTLIGAELFGVDFKGALPAAMAVEVFHNFSLIHDDIMDDAPLRRGQTTVHEKWDVNTGILSGDAMLINSYEYLEGYEAVILKKLFLVFNRTAIEVCEGQQYDIDFETRTDVTIEEYLKMIEYKTSVLIGAALKMGAIVAEASEENQELLYDFGRNLGIAFQLQDDYLDAFGDPETFGKQVGGDIIENKKTFLYLKAQQLGTKKEADELLAFFGSADPSDAFQKVEAVKRIFKSSGADLATKKEIEKYTQQAIVSLSKIDALEEGKKLLRQLGENLMQRNN
ncbi:MAG: polyprenyl synthetase family protein [Bacteroidota bacterium]